MRSLTLKTLNLSNGNMIGEKFFKLITSLYSEKIKRMNGLMNEDGMKCDKPSSFEEIIDHIMGIEQPLFFKQYEKTAHTIE